MLIRDFKDCEEFTAGDNTILRELLHPDKVPGAYRYSLAHATLRPGRSSTKHKLKASEVYYVLEGKGLMHIDEESSEVSKDQTIFIPPHAVQYIENIGDADLVFLCVVDPAWKIEDEEVM